MRTMRIVVFQAMFPLLLVGAAGLMSGCGGGGVEDGAVIKQPPPEVGGKDSMDFGRSQQKTPGKK